MIKNIIFSIIIITSAALTIFPFLDLSSVNDNNYVALINAGLGVFGVLLFLGRSALSRFVFLLWILLQLVVVQLPEKLMINFPGLDFGPLELTVISFTQYFTYLLEGQTVSFNGYLIQFNIVPLAYLLIFLIPAKTTKKVGVKIREAAEDTFELRLFRWNKLMEHITPQRVKVVQKVDFGDSQNWLLVTLSKPIKFKSGKVIYNALIKPKDDKNFRKNQPGQLGYFRLLKSRKPLRNGQLDLKNTTFVDWVFVK